MRKFRSSLSLFIFFIILTTFLGSFASAQNLDKYLRKGKLHPKMESILSELEEEQNKGRDFAKEFSSKRNIKIDERDRITIFIYLERDKPLNISALKAHGAEIIKGTFDVIKVAVPVGMLRAIANNVEGVRFMKLPDKPVSQVTSQGVGLTGASIYQSAGYTGSGVKVAVIDLGFKGLTSAILSGDLPGSIYVLDCTGTGCVPKTFPWDLIWEGEEHGTAVAEIVQDMAPGSQLYLMKIDDEQDLIDAKNFCISNGIKIINHSVGWFNKNFYDGFCYYSNPVCTVNNAYSNGILWVNAAGNFAQKHYEAIFTDSNSDNLHDHVISFFANWGDPININLTWNAWPATNQDYDLYLYDMWGNLVAMGYNFQTGTQTPTEQISILAPYTSIYNIVIEKYNATSNHWFKVFSLNHNLDPHIASRSLVSPADASGALAVAAISYNKWTTGPVEVFSSQGPTTDDRIKPDISGPDDVLSYTYGSFPGTSAAAPHVAGAAALILSANPGYSTSQLWNALTSSAIDMGSIGKDNVYGFGRLNLPAITETVSTPITPSGPDSGTTGNSYSYSTGGSSSNLGHSVQYFFDWGDGTHSGWLPVGTTNALKTWTSSGSYSVKVQARCSIHTSVVSTWSGILTVNISEPNLKPNLTPYNYYGSDKIILTKTPCAGRPNMVDEIPFYTTDTLYLAWVIINNGAAPTTTSASMAIYLDGQEIHTNTVAPLQPGQTASCCLCASIGPLSAGTHTIRIVVDTTNAITESNEADNEYTKTITVNVPPNPALKLIDFDGDRKSDIAIYRTSTGAWYVKPSGGGTPYGFGWGGDDSDKPTPGDYDGDGKTDIAVYRKAAGAWYIYPSGGGAPYGFGWGGDDSDKPVPGDYDGDGKTDIAVYRAGTGAWYVYPSGGGAPYGFGWGGDLSDKPAPGDYDGDGKTDIAVYRTGTGTWYVYPSGGGTPYGFGWGGDDSDKPVPGDYDGDGKTDIGIYRTSIGAWFVIPSGGGSPYGFGWGGDPSDIPVTMNLSAIE